MTTRLDEKGAYAVWVSPVQESRKWPLTGWLMKSLMDRKVLTWDTIADAKAWLQNAVTWWETKYEIKPYTP